MNLTVPDWCHKCAKPVVIEYAVYSNGKFWHTLCGQWLEEEENASPMDSVSVRSPNDVAAGGGPTGSDGDEDSICGFGGYDSGACLSAPDGQQNGAVGEGGVPNPNECRSTNRNSPLSLALALLTDACEVIRDREAMYGGAEKHWQATSQAASAYLRRRGLLTTQDLTPQDWGMLMILDKLMRQANAAKRDNLLDVCGYAACAQRVIESKEPSGG